MTSTPRAHWWISLALVPLGGLMAVVFFGPRQSLPVIPRPTEDANVLRVVYPQYLLLDPHRRLSPLPSYNQLILSLWEPLVECDPATGQPQPAAAQSWSWSDDRRVLTLKLRPDARWSNGEPVTAHDFVRSWRRLLGKPMEIAQTLFPLKNAEALHLGRLKDPATLGVRAVDDLTLRLELEQVRSSLVAELADPLLVPLHQGSEAAMADNACFQDPTLLVTNGPFRLLWADDNGFRLKACDFYHGRAEVRLAGVQFLRAYSPSLAPLLVSAGVADLISPMPSGKSRPEPTERAVHLERELELGVTSVDFNVTRGPLRDVRVRQALALALDRGGAVNRLDPGHMVPAWSWIPTMPGRPGLNLLQEDAEEARRLLAAAGYPGGRGFPVLQMSLPLWMLSDPFPPMWTEDWFQELGVKTHILYEPQTMRAKRLMVAGDYDVICGGLVATVHDAGDMLSGFLWSAEYSTTKWADPEVIRLLNEANTKTGAERLARLEKAERLVMAAVPAVPVMFNRRQAMLADDVRGWYEDPLARQSLKRLWLEPATPKADPGAPDVNPAPSSATNPAWRNWRLWLGVWLAGTVLLLAFLVADAWPWLTGSPRASFRATRLYLWPLDTLWWLLAPLILWMQNKLGLLDRRWPWSVVLHGLMAVLISGLFILLEATRMLLANHLPADFLPVVVNDLRWMGGWTYTPALIYLLLIFGLYALNFYRELQAGQRLTGELRVANAQLETRLVRASLDALKMQLHPHFLFNTLNSITSLIRNNRTREAEDVVAGLGELLRRSLDHRQEAKATLEHELEFLRRYLAIESIRFQDRLRVEFDIAPKCLPALVPGLILQPLVENAMKHGISRDPAARLLRISAARDGTRLLLTVYNDGPALPREDAALSAGIGVQNTLTRLQMLYGDEAHLWLRDQPPHGVRAEIILPFQPHSP